MARRGEASIVVKSGYNRLWKVSREGGPPTLVAPQWGNDGSFSPDGNQIVIDRMSRWDSEWRAYRGGQNTPLVILDLTDNSEVMRLLSDNAKAENLMGWKPKVDLREGLSRTVEWVRENADEYADSGYVK